jgi:hypothetical protein
VTFRCLLADAVRLPVLVALVATTAIMPAFACTRILWNEPGTPVLIGRKMDWPTSTDPVLTVLPRGLVHDGGNLGETMEVAANPLRWTSKYGSLVTTVYGIGTADGLNERGLSAHMLYLPSTDFGPRDPAKAALQAGLWAQYLLDTAATVAEALALLDGVQLVMVEAHGSKATVDVALEDASGDSAIIEYVAGKQVVHHGREFRVMTNDPPYDEQLRLLKGHDFSNPQQRDAVAWQRQPTRPLCARELFSEYDADAKDRTRGRRRAVRHRTQCTRAVRRALQDFRHLQHRISQCNRRHQQAILLRADDKPKRRYRTQRRRHAQVREGRYALLTRTFLVTNLGRSALLPMSDGRPEPPLHSLPDRLEHHI